MISQAEAKAAILDLLRGAVPERDDEICSIWSQYAPIVEIVPDRPGVTMRATDKRIQFSLKTIDLYWLLGFSAWKSIEAYSPAILIASDSGIPIQKVLDRDEALGKFERDYKARFAAAQDLIEATTTGDIDWPPDVPRPQGDRDAFSDDQDKAAFDLSLLALASALLHELKHVIYLNEKNNPATLPEEEIGCDVWAREFLTVKLAEYAQAHSHDYEDVCAKRATSIALAAIIVYAITPSHGHWGTSDYPPIADRLEALINGFPLPPNSKFWVWTACLVVGILRKQHRAVNITGDSPKVLVERLLSELR
ncbi:phage exclusion protein Lit family protein [Mesorhizobium erdmanii]|uniref:phage exclusion protein Lit family protein n=1 Tax=Mesorhizobium erdmanii TaxID=1777866 RepID=UPI000519966B|nr:phage exclusion protein Lit family protein [Mesorhizobium erdmanii]